MKVLVTDKLNKEGVKILQREPGIEVDLKEKVSPEELIDGIGKYDAVIIRSQTKLTSEVICAGKKLKVIGRAGVGVDNVDVEAASKQGIIVMNTPGGNATSAAEHTISLILALSRNLLQADMSLRRNEWNRSHFVGVEVFGKILGIIGFGRIGSEVAKRAKGLGMHVLAFDPYISIEVANKLEIEISDFESLLKQSDYISLHVPLTNETHYLIGADELGMMKPTARLINCARGGVVNERSLCRALKQGKIAGAALDVYEEEPPLNSPLFELESCILTPHLGAATRESQTNVAKAIAQQVIDALTGRKVVNAVNASSVEPEIFVKLKPYISLAEKLGRLQRQLLTGHIDKVFIEYTGELANYQLSPLTAALIKGLLDPIMEEAVNYISAPVLARERGIEVIETKTTETKEFTNLIIVEAHTKKVRSSVVGTLFSRDDLRVVRIDGYHVDALPSGYMLVIRNNDKPGLIGKVGTILGDNNINIAGMTCGRKEAGVDAVTVLNLDRRVPGKILKQIQALPLVNFCKLIGL